MRDPKSSSLLSIGLRTSLTYDQLGACHKITLLPLLGRDILAFVCYCYQ
jgi:hypothetical protein